ncbi:phage tail protein [Lactiplantibacillus plantarum]|nr:phage tail protein [Lactiplantibacillus plantarum]
MISEKVATKDFSAYQDTTAKAISSKVESRDFNTYKSQTADAISSKVATKDFSTYKSQTADAINIRVTKKDLIDQINIQAGNTLISSSGQLTLSGKNIYFDTKNPVIIPSANITGTLNGKTINGSTFNGSTFNAGDSISNSNNTSNFYPFTIEPTGKASTTLFNSVDALRTEMSGGGLRTMYRAINSSGSQYEAYDGNFSGDMISLNSGFTNGKDMSFSQSVSGSQLTGQVLISPLNGLTLHGDTQQITFNGTSADVTPKGIIITPYGNINPNGTQNTWYVGNNMAMKTAQFGIDADNKVGIDLFRPTFVDEIGAMGNRLANGRLLLHAVDGDAQMYLLNDGKPAFVSPTIYNRTYSNGANMFVTSAGRVGRSTSASKYKLAISRSDDTLQADRLMTLKPASWNDKVATEKMAESLSNGEIPVEAEINLKRHYGLIAEDLRDAGLDEFLITGDNGQIEGIEYDRLWTVLIPKIKQLNNRINELERKII